MGNASDRKLVDRVRAMPPSMLDARLLADYVRTGVAYDLSTLTAKSGTSLRQVALLVVAGSLEGVDKLPGYTVTSEIFDIAKNIYSLGESRLDWNRIRNHHKPEFLLSQKSREEMRQLRSDPRETRKHFARILFKSWAVFWDDSFIVKMIDELGAQVISNIPATLLNNSICFAAVGKSGAALQFVPQHLRSLAICARAVQNDPSAIAFTPSLYRTEIQKLSTTD